MACCGVLTLYPEVMTESETEPLGEVSDGVMPEGYNFYTPQQAMMKTYYTTVQKHE